MEEKNKNKKDRKGAFFSFLIVVLTITLVGILVGIMVISAPNFGGYYEVLTPDIMLQGMKYSGYDRILECKKQNEALGIYEDNDPSYVIPYAIADYYENTMIYKGYKNAKHPEAAVYKAKMDKAKEKMGEYSYIADEIDEYFELNEE